MRRGPRAKRTKREPNRWRDWPVRRNKNNTKSLRRHPKNKKDKDMATVLLHKIDQCDRDKSKTIIVWGTYIWRMYRIFVLLSASNFRSNLYKILCALHVFPVQYLAIEYLVFLHWYILIHLNRKYCHDLSKLFLIKCCNFLIFYLKYLIMIFSGNN